MFAVAVALLLGLQLADVACAQADPLLVIYQSGFEKSEGFDERFELRGQSGWIGEGSGGNGLVNGFFTGRGQHAYVGFNPPAPKDVALSLWRPLNFNPLASNDVVITFTVTLLVADSSNGHYDDFRWSVYDTNGVRMFSLMFDNSDLMVYSLLENQTNFVPTNVKFADNTAYDLAVAMDFSRNRWSAALGGVSLTHELPIRTLGRAASLGDIDAVWNIREPGKAGDNSMIFDDLVVTAEKKPAAWVLEAGRLTETGWLFSLYGPPGLPYVLEDTEDFSNWIPLQTNAMVSLGVKEFIDGEVKTLPRRFYRARGK